MDKRTLAKQRATLKFVLKNIQMAAVDSEKKKGPKNVRSILCNGLKFGQISRADQLCVKIPN